MNTKPTISWADFEKIDIRTGTIIDCQPFPKARNPSFILSVDFGELGVLKSSAQITELYSMEDLKGMQVIAVVNFEPKQIANIKSQCLVMGVYTKKGVNVLTPSIGCPNGLQVG